MIEAEGVSVELGGVEALSDVTASVDRGRFVGLVGPNGAGKTTLLRTIRATLSPDRGTVRVAGERIDDLPSKAASRLVASVPQDTSLPFGFSVRETVAMGRTPHLSRFGTPGPDDRTAVDRALDRTDVAALERRAVTDLSGGERQRVLLARALAQDAPVLALDEPTASLDINHQIRTLELVRELVAAGKTAVAAIHDLNLAARYCDELLVLSGGETLAGGPPEAVLTPETLERGFGVRATVDAHPLTGAPLVTSFADAGHDREAPDADPDPDPPGRVHVVGGGRARPLLARLAAAGYEVSVGAASEDSAAAEAAHAHSFDAVTVPPCTPVDDAAAAAVRERIEAADATVVTDFDVTAGTAANLRAAAAAPPDALVVSERRPFAERNRVGPEAARLHRGLRERAVATPTDLAATLAAVREAVAGGREGAAGRRNADGSPPSATADAPDSGP